MGIGFGRSNFAVRVPKQFELTRWRGELLARAGDSELAAKLINDLLEQGTATGAVISISFVVPDGGSGNRMLCY